MQISFMALAGAVIVQLGFLQVGYAQQGLERNLKDQQNRLVELNVKEMMLEAQLNVLKRPAGDPPGMDSLVEQLAKKLSRPSDEIRSGLRSQYVLGQKIVMADLAGKFRDLINEASQLHDDLAVFILTLQVNRRVYPEQPRDNFEGVVEVVLVEAAKALVSECLRLQRDTQLLLAGDDRAVGASDLPKKHELEFARAKLARAEEICQRVRDRAQQIQSELAKVRDRQEQLEQTLEKLAEVQQTTEKQVERLRQKVPRLMQQQKPSDAGEDEVGT